MTDRRLFWSQAAKLHQQLANVERRVVELEAQAAHIVRERVIEEEMDEFLRDAYARLEEKNPHSGVHVVRVSAGDAKLVPTSPARTLRK